jgi:hypothetical protein
VARGAPQGAPNAVELLVAAGFDVNALYRATPLGWARYFEQPALIELLEPITADRREEDGPA